MAIRDLLFKITARDQTGEAFNSVRKGLTGVEGAARSTSERIAGVGKRLQNFGIAASAFSAGVGLAFRDSLQLYDTQEKAMAKVRQAVEATGGAAGKTAEELFRAASGLQEISRYGDEAILDRVTGQLLTFTNIAGEQFDRAQAAILDIATVLGSDLQPVAIQVGKALNDPAKGLSALARSGIQFTEEQHEVIKSLAETGRMAEAQSLILAELEKQYGGQAQAAAQVGIGALDQLSNSWGDLKEEVGGILAELLPPVVSFLKTLISGFTSLPEPMKRFTVVAGLIGVALGPVIAAIGLLVVGATAISAPVLAAGAAIVAITAAVVAFWPEIEGLGAAVGEAWTAAADWVSQTVDRIQDYLLGKLKGAFDWVKGAVAEVGDSFFRLYDAVVGNSYVPDMVDEIGQHFARLDGNMVKVAEDTTDSVGGVFQDMATAVGDAIGGMVREGEFKLSSLRDALLGAGGSIASSAVSGVTNAAGSALGTALESAFSSLVPSFNTGADFTVGGQGGLDRNLVAFNATRGERVQVTPAGQGSGGAPVVVNITTPDAASFQRSRAQVSATIAQAVARGQRSM